VGAAVAVQEMGVRERDVENHLRKRVKAAGGKVFKWASPAQRGVPDDIVLLHGQVWFIEVKAPSGKLTKLQELMGSYIREYTDNYAVLWSKEDVDRWLVEVGMKN